MRNCLSLATWSAMTPTLVLCVQIGKLCLRLTKAKNFALSGLWCQCRVQIGSQSMLLQCDERWVKLLWGNGISQVLPARPLVELRVDQGGLHNWNWHELVKSWQAKSCRYNIYHCNCYAWVHVVGSTKTPGARHAIATVQKKREKWCKKTGEKIQRQTVLYGSHPQKK